MSPRSDPRPPVSEKPSTEACGCSCGCHNTSGHAGMYHGCRNNAKWLPEYKVWACDSCLVTCDD